MKIPKEFKIANNTIHIEVVDSVVGNNKNEVFGFFNDVTNTIKIARTIEGTRLNEEQILNTFFHELFHTFQFFFDNTYSEAEAQCYANFMREFESSAIYD